MSYLIMFLLCGTLGADAGGSTWWSNIWKSKEDGGKIPYNLRFIPELILSMIVGVIAVHIWAIEWEDKYQLLFWFVCTGTSYLSIQTGHAAILKHEDVDKYPKQRDNTLTPVVTGLCKLLRIQYEKPLFDKEGNYAYTEAYVWMFWAVKGFLMTLPFGGIGAIGLPLGYEIGSHFKHRPEYWRHNPHFVSEFMAYGLAIGLPSALLLSLAG